MAVDVVPLQLLFRRLLVTYPGLRGAFGGGGLDFGVPPQEQPEPPPPPTVPPPLPLPDITRPPRSPPLVPQYPLPELPDYPVFSPGRRPARGPLRRGRKRKRKRSLAGLLVAVARGTVTGAELTEELLQRGHTIGRAMPRVLSDFERLIQGTTFLPKGGAVRTPGISTVGARGGLVITGPTHMPELWRTLLAETFQRAKPPKGPSNRTRVRPGVLPRGPQTRSRVGRTLPPQYPAPQLAVPRPRTSAPTTAPQAQVRTQPATQPRTAPRTAPSPSPTPRRAPARAPSVSVDPLLLSLGVHAWLRAPQPRVSSPAAPAQPSPLLQPQPAPRATPQTARAPLTSLLPNPLTSPLLNPPPDDPCRCTRTRTRKPRKPRTECRTGTYIETAKGTIKQPKRVIQCQ